ncbi:S-type anion channel SLAH4-like [Andrographis paniculata]|uniref:S-type anion channel SLAH4-like n=1 Tax=Andrographis paniculata TaxID=175694 RepID=UPI0021E839ED|nr:S-type anion channel SLAH4-like [Andrographis paniculata]
METQKMSEPNTNDPMKKTVITLREICRLDSMGAILTRIHAGCFGISLSLGYQALLWKVLLRPQKNSRIPFSVPEIFSTTFLTVVWSFSVLVLVLLSLLYALKCLLRFQTIKAEFMHHVGVNYLFAPWISWLLVLESAPFVTPRNASFVVLWWIFAIPVVILDVKIYGQWFTKGKRVLTAVANPTSQLSVIGNLVGSRAAAKMAWTEVSIFLFSLGMVHYLVLFVTLYQRIPYGAGPLPAMLRPVFSLFFAVPSLASLAWYSITGSFDTAAKMLFYLSLFIFLSLICRPLLFKKSMKRFSVAWWAYSYPITMLALASTRYQQQVPGRFPRVVSLLLSALSVIVLFALLLFSAMRPKSLLPNHDSLHAALPTHRSSNTTIPSATP